MLGALQALWTHDTPEFSGQFYRYSGLKFSPKPFQKPYPPLHIGGSSPAAHRRVARFGDGWHTLRQTPKQFAEGRSKIIKLTEAAGRDPAALHYSITVPMAFTGKPPSAAVEDRTALTGTDDDIADTIRADEAAGLDEIVVGISTDEIAEHNDAMTHFMQRIWPKVS
jgi:alkanesulfonate monooxygenase SsuD/methylene tetrahydromethanopterin reductase-like flavin-dependent oxidoreductase (luciferase family)